MGSLMTVPGLIFPGQRIAFFPLPDMTADRQCTSTGFALDFFGEFVTGVLLSARNDDVRTHGGESLDHLFAKPSTAACYERDFAVESKE